jgi:PAS domain S-box-containing protein
VALSFSVNLWHRVIVEALAQLISLDEDAMRLLLDEIPVGIGIAEPVQPDGTVHPDARIVYYNRRWVEMFGFDVEDVETVEQATRRLYPDPEVHTEMLRMRYAAAGRIREGGRSEQTEIRAMGADGEWLDVMTGTTVVGDRLIVTMLDISERKRTARRLQEAQRSLENSAFEVTENIPAGTYTMVQPPEGGFACFRFLSSRFLEMCGLTREACEQDPLNVFALVHPEDYDEFLRKNIETLERKVVFSEEFRVIIRGETRWFHAASNPRPLPDGTTLWEGVLTDITDRKEAEVARTKSDRSMKLAASAARLGFWEIDISTQLDRWDAEMARIHGIRHEDFDGHWEKFVHPDDYDEVMRETRRMLADETTFEMEYRIVRPSGETRFIREHGIVIRDREGRPVSASGVMQDITERRQAEEEIHASTQRMRLAASAAGLGFWSRDNATGLEEWDDEMLRIYGVRREDFDGRWEPFVHPADAATVQRLTRDAAASGHVGAYEYRIIRPDGTVRHVRGRSTFVPGRDGRAAREIGVNFDITGEKEAAERENRLQADHRSDLEKKLKTSLNAAVVAHEINQPLSAILLDTQVALERVQGDTPELAHARKFLCSTIAHATRAVETIGKVSTLLRSVPTTPHEVNLVDVVRSAALYAKDDLRTAGIALDTTGTGRAVTIQGDEGQLLLAVSNMLRNAIEALRSDDGGRPREIVIALTRHKTSVILSVADSGPGLPPNILAKIPLHTTKPDGTGLGLFIVQTVAENHGAKLEARQSALGGAELRLVFPVTN